MRQLTKKEKIKERISYLESRINSPRITPEEILGYAQELVRLQELLEYSL